MLFNQHTTIKSKDDKGFSNPESALFDALLTTKNKGFEDSINSIVREWEKGTDFTYEEIKEQSLESYRNLIARYKRLNKSWLPTQTSRTDDQVFKFRLFVPRSIYSKMHARTPTFLRAILRHNLLLLLDSKETLKVHNQDISLNHGASLKLKEIHVLWMESNGGGAQSISA